MQKARRHHRSGSDRLRAHGFRVSFTPLLGVLFTFPSRYSCAIGLPGVLSLGGWCRRIRTGLLRPRPTQGPGQVGERSAYGAVTRSGAPFQAPSATSASSFVAGPATPRAPRRPRFGLAPFRSPLLGGSLLFSSPPTTGMFRFVGFASPIRVMPRLRAAGCPIRTPADRRPLAPPRRLSRPAASFLASGSQGILRAPSLASRSRSPHGAPAPPGNRLVFSSCLLSFQSCQRTAQGEALHKWRMWGSNPRPPACKAGALAD